MSGWDMSCGPSACPAAWAPSENSYLWAAMCPAAQEPKSPLHHSICWVWVGSGGMLGSHSKWGSQQRVPRLRCGHTTSSTCCHGPERGLGGPGAVLQLGELDPISTSVPAGGVVVCPWGLGKFNPPSPLLAM